MSKKMFALISGLVTAVSTAALAYVTYEEFANATEINSAISIAAGAIVQICNLFVKPAAEKKEAE